MYVLYTVLRTAYISSPRIINPPSKVDLILLLYQHHHASSLETLDVHVWLPDSCAVGCSTRPDSRARHSNYSYSGAPSLERHPDHFSRIDRAAEPYGGRST